MRRVHPPALQTKRIAAVIPTRSTRLANALNRISQKMIPTTVLPFSLARSWRTRRPLPHHYRCRR